MKNFENLEKYLKKEDRFTVSNTTKGKPPRLPFEQMKNAVLGEKYNLSLVIVGDALSRKLNRIYRGKDKKANVLSFPLSNTEGEIFINLNEAKKDAPHFSLSYKEFVGLLFVHGLFHLKGMLHGSRMEHKEKEILSSFGIVNNTTHTLLYGKKNNRNRN